MIHAAVLHIANQLNLFLKRSFELGEDIVVVSNILEQDGTLAPNINNKLLVFLINVEKETTTARAAGFTGPAPTASTYPPVFLNLYVMIAANFACNNYPEALKFLSNAVGFFQRQPVFDHHSTPDLDKRIAKLALDIENLNLQDMSSLWGVLSGKYLPSILYKVRMISFDSGDIRSQLPAIRGTQPSVN